MTRSGYSDDIDSSELNLWRGAVESAIRGKRGQRLLKDLRAALDAMPKKRLVTDELIQPDGEVCALGALAKHRGLKAEDLPDPYDSQGVADTFNIAEALAKEIVYMNDEAWYGITPEKRWELIRGWVEEQIKEANNE